MARKPGSTPQAMKDRAAKTAAAMAPASALAQSAEKPKKRTNPAQFAREVRAEARKITWTSRKETWITSVMVAIMVVMASIFLFGVDALISFMIGLVLNVAKAG